MIHLIQYMKQWLDKYVGNSLGFDKSEKDVEKIKQHTSKKFNDVTRTMKKQTDLQKKLIQRTQTYYIGRAMGVYGVKKK